MQILKKRGMDAEVCRIKQDVFTPATTVIVYLKPLGHAGLEARVLATFARSKVALVSPFQKGYARL
ncbi:hypothetical protein ACFL20_09370 [Spirochaetota bacterium]